MAKAVALRNEFEGDTSLRNRRDRPSKNLVFRGMALLFENFTGAKSEFNREGDRNFCVVLPEDVALELADRGFNVKKRESREGDSFVYHLRVKINFGSKKPPVIYMVTNRGKTLLTEEMLYLLDVATIEYADLDVNPYEWSNHNGSGTTVYLNEGYFHLYQSELSRAYEDVQDTNALTNFQEENGLEEYHVTDSNMDGDEVIEAELM